LVSKQEIGKVRGKGGAIKSKEKKIGNIRGIDNLES
jgi:hypothetical protein